MSHITREQLQHLAKLSRIDLSDEELEALLPQLEQIIGFVGQLEECDVAGIAPMSHPQADISLQPRAGVAECDKTTEFFHNVAHQIRQQAIGITGKLSEQG